jgi:hypothetical protein
VKGAADDFLDEVAAANPSLLIAECRLPEAGVTYRAATTQAETSRIDVAYNAVVRCGQRAQDRDDALTALNDAEALLEPSHPDYVPPTDPLYDERVVAAQDRRDEYTLADDMLRETEQSLIFMRSLNRVYEYGSGL